MNEITYSKCGDYFIPEIALSEQATKPLGKYGRLRRTNLQEHRPNEMYWLDEYGQGTG